MFINFKKENSMLVLVYLTGLVIFLVDFLNIYTLTLLNIMTPGFLS